MAAPSLTLYTNKACPFAQRVAIALQEVGKEPGDGYKREEIDLENKPDWYKDVNPELKVPVLDVDGKKIAESSILVELVSDLHPEKNLTPSDPIKRSQARFAIEYFGSKVVPQLYSYMREKDIAKYVENCNAAYSRFNELLLEQSSTGPFFFGEQYSIVDISLAPFVGRIQAMEKKYMSDQRFTPLESSDRLKEYLQAITARRSFEETFCGGEFYLTLIERKIKEQKALAASKTA